MVNVSSLLLRVCIPALLQASDYMAGYFDTDMHMKWRERWIDVHFWHILDPDVNWGYRLLKSQSFWWLVFLLLASLVSNKYLDDWVHTRLERTVEIFKAKLAFLWTKSLFTFWKIVSTYSKLFLKVIFVGVFTDHHTLYWFYCSIGVFLLCLTVWNRGIQFNKNNTNNSIILL